MIQAKILLRNIDSQTSRSVAVYAISEADLKDKILALLETYRFHTYATVVARHGV